MGNPEPFDKKFALEAADGDYNILANHARYSEKGTYHITLVEMSLKHGRLQAIVTPRRLATVMSKHRVPVTIFSSKTLTAANQGFS